MTERKPLTLRRNFSWTFVGNLSFAAAQWGMLISIAKMGTPEMVGQFALGLAITTPVLMFASLQLQSVQATDAQYHYSFGDYLALRIVSTTVGLLVILSIILIAGYRRDVALVILLVGLAKAVDTISDVFYGLFLQREYMDRVAKSLIMRGSLSVIMLSLGLYFSSSVIWGVAGLMFAWALVLLGYDIRNGVLTLQASPPQAAPDLAHRKANIGYNLRLYWKVSTLGRLTWLALPLGVVMGLITLNANIPRYFVEGYLGQRELGIFAAIAYIMVAGQPVITALGQAVSPRLARYYAAGDGAGFKVLLLKLVSIGAILGILGVLIPLVAGREILSVLYGPEYGEYVNVFFWLMVAGATSYLASLLGWGLTSARRFKIQVPLFASAGCTSAAACFWLVPSAGLKGAAVALILSSVVQLVGVLAAMAGALRTLGDQGNKEGGGERDNR